MDAELKPVFEQTPEHGPDFAVRSRSAGLRLHVPTLIRHPTRTADQSETLDLIRRHHQSSERGPVGVQCAVALNSKCKMKIAVGVRPDRRHLTVWGKGCWFR